MKPICIIFPKPFEASIFLLSIPIFKFKRLGEWWFKIGMLLFKQVRVFEVKVIDESDFQFYQRLEQLKNDKQYILMGSCGLNKISKGNVNSTLNKDVLEKYGKGHLSDEKDQVTTSLDLYEPVLIKQTVKYDRGELWSLNNIEQNKLKTKINNSIKNDELKMAQEVISYCDQLQDKLLSIEQNYRIKSEEKNLKVNSFVIEYIQNITTQERFKTNIDKWHPLNLEKGELFNNLKIELNMTEVIMNSNNFLMNSTKTEIGSETVFDMETYDFVKFIQNNNFKLLACIRFISDITGEDQRNTRGQFKMNKILKIMKIILNYCPILDCIMNDPIKPILNFSKQIINKKLLGYKVPQSEIDKYMKSFM